MDYTVQKVRERTTPQGCKVVTKSSFNLLTGCVDEDVTLSHPRTLDVVAYSVEEILARQHR